MDFAKRNQDMESRYLSGETLQSIGKSYGITRERVRQILAKRGIKAQEGGAALYRRLNPRQTRGYIRKTPICLEGLRYCRKCDTIDELSEFYKVKHKNGGYHYLHKPCRNAYMKRRYEKYQLERRFM